MRVPRPPLTTLLFCACLAACVGGQSGTEETPVPCAVEEPHELAIDEATAARKAREIAAQITKAVERTVLITWRAPGVAAMRHALFSVEQQGAKASLEGGLCHPSVYWLDVRIRALSDDGRMNDVFQCRADQENGGVSLGCELSGPDLAESHVSAVLPSFSASSVLRLRFSTYSLSGGLFLIDEKGNGTGIAELLFSP